MADVSVGGGAAKYSWEEEAPLYLYYCDNETVEGVEFASLDAVWTAQSADNNFSFSRNVLTRQIH